MVSSPGADTNAERRSVVPQSLLAGDLPEFWREVASRIERNGDAWRGTVRLSGYSPASVRTLTTLIGRPGRKTVDLALLEKELIRLGVSKDLPGALAALGAPVSPMPAARRAERSRVERGRLAAKAQADTWPEQWASDWVDEIIRAGLLARRGEDEALLLVHQVRQILDALDDLTDSTFSRVDLAAEVLGSAHALDDGTLLERATVRALAYRQGGSELARADPWSSIGGHRSLISGAALTWHLPVTSDHSLAQAVAICDELSIPFVVTQMALDSAGLGFVSGSDVLLVENPRVLEHAVQIRSSQSMICGNGNPSMTVRGLVDRLIGDGAVVRYHGDFDAAGIEICERMRARGVRPWRMTAGDYLDALEGARAAGVRLPIDPTPCGPTPWDPDLQDVFNEHRLVVHEERLLQQIVTQ